MADKYTTKTVGDKLTIRIETKEELGGRPTEFNHDGLMDYLFGKTVQVKRTFWGSFEVIAEPNADGYTHWYITSSYATVIE